MAETPIQSFQNHTRRFPLFHFVAMPLLYINLAIRIVYAVMHRGARLVWWEIVFAFALIALGFAARLMALTVQDRLIMLEERLRMARVLPADLQPKIGDLSRGQLVALRFCPDDELPDLTRAALAGELPDRKAIKQRIKKWRPDYVRA
jgi:hypothetical protein